MGNPILLLNILASVAGIAFFSSFALTFRSTKWCMTAAAILYGIGVIICLSPPAYFYFVAGAHSSIGDFPALEWLVPVLLLGFAVVAAVSIWLPFSPKIALRFGIFLFGVFMPLLVVLRELPEFIHFHHDMRSLQLTWFVYVLLWFRIRENWARFGVDKPITPG